MQENWSVSCFLFPRGEWKDHVDKMADNRLPKTVRGAQPVLKKRGIALK